MTTDQNLETVKELISKMSDADLAKMRIFNGISAMLSIDPESRVRRLQELLAAEVKRRVEAHPDRWTTLKELMRRGPE